MKKIVSSIICCLLTVNGFSAGWEGHWIAAMKYNSEENYISAEKEFDLSISHLEKSEESEKHSYVYIDRARLHMSQDRYDVALIDLDKALDSEQLGKSDRIKGLVSRISTYSNLGERERGFEDYLEFKGLYNDFPEIEYGETNIVIT